MVRGTALTNSTSSTAFLLSNNGACRWLRECHGPSGRIIWTWRNCRLGLVARRGYSTTETVLHFCVFTSDYRLRSGLFKHGRLRTLHLRLPTLNTSTICNGASSSFRNFSAIQTSTKTEAKRKKLNREISLLSIHFSSIETYDSGNCSVTRIGVSVCCPVSLPPMPQIDEQSDEN